MTEPGTDQNALVSLLWELKAAWQARGRGEVLLTGLLLDKAELDRFLAEAAAIDDPEIRSIVLRISALRTTMPASFSADATTTKPASAAAQAPRSGFDALRGGAVLVAALLVSAAAIHSIWSGGSALKTNSATIVPRDAAAPAAAPVVAPAAVVPAPAAVAEPQPPATPAAPRPLSIDNSDVVLRIHGSNTVGEKLSPQLVEGFLRSRGAMQVAVVAGASDVETTILASLPGRQKSLAVEIHAHGSSTAFADLDGGTADIGQSSRRVKPDEVAKLSPRLGDLSRPGSAHVLALDGLAIIVHPQNRLSSLSIEQVAGLFAGRIKDWSEIGGAKGPVHLYARDDVSGTWPLRLRVGPHRESPLPPQDRSMPTARLVRR